MALRQIVLGLLVVASALGIVGSAASGEEAKVETAAVSLVLVNDIDQMNAVKDRGGLAKFAAVVAAERARNPNTLAIHAGDTISPCLLCGLDQGAHVIDILNSVRPDIFVPGNHEFDFGKEVFLARMGEANFPIIAANIRLPDGSAVPGIADTRIVDIAGLRIGFVGATTEDTLVSSSPGDMQIAPAADAAIAQAKALREAGADLVVAVVHTPIDVDYELFNNGAFDLVLTGHDHDLRLAWNGRTVMVESSSQGDFVTIIRLAVTIETAEGQRKVSFRPGFDVVDSMDVAPDPTIQAKIDLYEQQLDSELSVVIGSSVGALDSRRAVVRGEEAAIGNLITDALRAATGADVALMNGGGIRANKEYAPGSTLTRRDVLTELPFGNRSVLVELSGTDLLAALENGFSQIEKGAGRFPQVSGLSLVVDRAAAPGSRIVEARIGDKPIEPAATYKVAANDYMLGGGDGYSALAKGRVLIGKIDGTLLANAVMAYIRAKGAVDVKVEGRIRYR